MEIGRPFSTLTPIGKDKNISGVLNGNDVRLEDKDGAVVAERKNARKYLPIRKKAFLLG